MRQSAALAIAILVSIATGVRASGDQSSPGPGGERPYSPYADWDQPMDVYFGDTHVHTGLSADAGGADLGAVWQDPDFDPGLDAFYYARVIEIPTPRWTAYDQVKFKLDLPADIPLKVQERAYTSPIWYKPRGSDVTAR